MLKQTNKQKKKSKKKFSLYKNNKEKDKFFFDQIF